MSEKQIAHAVREGRKVTVYLPSGREVSGYVMGMDDFHWALCTADLDVLLVHKSTDAIRIHTHTTFKTESKVEEIEERVAPFRDWVLKNHFNHN